MEVRYVTCDVYKSFHVRITGDLWGCLDSFSRVCRLSRPSGQTMEKRRAVGSAPSFTDLLHAPGDVKSAELDG